MKRWTYITILGRDNQRTTIIMIYRPCNTRIEDIGGTTVVNNTKKKKEYPHKAAIIDIIKEIKKFPVK